MPFEVNWADCVSDDDDEDDVNEVVEEEEKEENEEEKEEEGRGKARGGDCTSANRNYPSSPGVTRRRFPQPS